MKLFKKLEPQTVEVKGHALVCPICANKLFRTEKNVLVQKSILAREWSTCFVCSECSYVFWFWS